MAEVVSGAVSRPTAPQPGDGAYLAASSRGQPGDRSHWPTNGGGPGHGGQRGSGHRGGPRRGGHRGQPRGGPSISQPGPSHATEVHAAEPEAPMERPPRRPKQPCAPVATTESQVEASTERPPHRPKQPRALVPTNESQFEAPTERPPHRQKQPGALVPTNESQFEEATAYAMLAVALPPPKSLRSKKPKGSARLDGHLNAEAASFTPGPSSKDLPTRSDAVSRSSSGSRHPGTTVRSDGEGNPAAKSKPRKGKKKKDVEVEVPSTPPSPAPARSARRAAFEQQTKLTTNATKDRLAAAVARPAEPKKVKKKNEEELKDDHVSVLTRGLKSRPFLECPICFNGITPSQPMWSCQPPDRPPAPPVGLDPTPPDLASHYSACYTPFHLSCIHDWANRSLIEERDRARVAGRDTEEVTWRCPGCQKRRTDPVGGYRCFCGRLSSPPTLLSAPHSCGEGCSRKRSGCGHACPLPCHPGPCPPCQVALIAPCPSHHTPLTVKCAVASSNNAALTPVCDETCYRQKQCGNPNHLCQDLCHYGPCKSCDELETVRCFCGEDEKQVFCGWDRAQEKMCARVGADGETERWAGRYSCGRECEMLFDCGIHPCQEKCHSHPLHPLPCPTSPAVITTCACGSTPLSHLPHPPRKDCLAPIPTCSSSCPKSRPCGHQCPRKCHTGPCPPCHEEVVRPCRCGESMLLVPCDELRVKMEKHEDVTCERVCRALRNCGRHECGRVCCPLAYKAKSKKKKPNDDMDILLHGQDDLHECHLTCGKLLSCGLHSCPKKDHKGACGRCLQASYDELICHCGNTVIYPPVACGTTITCLFPCDRPPPLCGHPKTSHQCHEQAECPPCPFLAAKPCLCGKDPSVKNVRCSQEKVSCGQPCGNLLGCGYHKCEKSCHKPGECDGCTQTCNKPKKVCKHPCTAVCHAPAKCPENDPCQHIVTQSCSCGNVQQRTSCGASVTNSTSREQVILKCNSECAIRQRNARLADALGIQQHGKDGKVTEEWKNDELRQFAAPNLAFVKMVENTFAEFIKGTRQTMVLPHMPVSKRTFVSSLADAYHLGREMVDAEPNRSVQIRRRIDTRVPTPLLSVVVTVKEVKPTLGALGNLRAKPATSSWAQSNPGATLSSIVGDHSGPSTRAPSPAGGSNTPRSTIPAPPTSISALGPAAVIGQAASRSPTPVPPMPVMNGTGTVATVTVHQGSVAGTVGKVDEDDWDQSGDEA